MGKMRRKRGRRVKMKKGEKEITACPFCLSSELDFTPGDGYAGMTYFGIGPVGGVPVCKVCKKLVYPIVFKNTKEYEKAKKELGK